MVCKITYLIQPRGKLVVPEDEAPWRGVEVAFHPTCGSIGSLHNIPGSGSMMIGCVEPRDLLRWFYGHNNKHDVMCVLLAASAEDRRAANEFISDFCAANMAMGGRVCFFIPSPDPNEATLTQDHKLLPGHFVGAGIITPFNDVAKRVGMSNEIFSRYVEMLSNEIALFSSSFQECLGIDPDIRARLCVFVKNVSEDFAVVPLGCDWTAGAMKDWLVQVARICNRPAVRDQIVLKRILSASSRIEEHRRELMAKRKALISSLGQINNKFYRSSVFKEKISHYIMNKELSEESLMNLVGELGWSMDKRVLDDHRWPKIFALARRIAVLRESVAGLIGPDVHGPIDLSEMIDAQKTKSEETLRLIQDLSFKPSWLRLPLSLSGFGWVEKGVDRINRWGDFGEKLNGLIELIKSTSV